MVGEVVPPSPDAPPPAHEHSQVYTVANVITVLRLALIPFFFMALLSGKPNSDLTAFLLFAAAASTDFLDGMIARRTGTVTAVGKVIDPIVDRLLIAMGVIGLYLVDRLDLWIVLVLVLRDLYLLSGAYVLERDHVILPVTYIGKVTTAVLLTAFSLLILGWPVLPGGMLLGTPLMYAGMALSLTAAVDYTIKASRARREARSGRAREVAAEVRR